MVYHQQESYIKFREELQTFQRCLLERLFYI